jgi:hypothetical protein
MSIEFNPAQQDARVARPGPRLSPQASANPLKGRLPDSVSLVCCVA